MSCIPYDYIPLYIAWIGIKLCINIHQWNPFISTHHSSPQEELTLMFVVFIKFSSITILLHSGHIWRYDNRLYVLYVSNIQNGENMLKFHSFLNHSLASVSKMEKKCMAKLLNSLCCHLEKRLLVPTSIYKIKIIKQG